MNFVQDISDSATGRTARCLGHLRLCDGQNSSMFVYVCFLVGWLGHLRLCDGQNSSIFGRMVLDVIASESLLQTVGWIFALEALGYRHLRNNNSLNKHRRAQHTVMSKVRACV